jgi:hypothetical protein
VNPASVGAQAADTELRNLFRAIAEQTRDGQLALGWLATATVDADAPNSELQRLTTLASQAGITGRLVISRDIVPMLVAPPRCPAGAWS